MIRLYTPGVEFLFRFKKHPPHFMSLHTVESLRFLHCLQNSPLLQNSDISDSITLLTGDFKRSVGLKPLWSTVMNA